MVSTTLPETSCAPAAGSECEAAAAELSSAAGVCSAAGSPEQPTAAQAAATTINTRFLMLIEWSPFRRSAPHEAVPHHSGALP
jgi:hypothetical protein